MKNSTLKAAKSRLQGLAHSVQFNGNIPIPSSNGSGLCSANGGIVPPVLVQEDRVPKFYQDAIAFCGATSPSQLPNTALVYNLMVTSQLPRDVLGNIWSLVNRTLPGQLTRQEFFSCLALIALAQRGQSLSALCDVTTLPIPYFQSFKAHEKPTKSSKKTSKNRSEQDGPSFSTKAASVQDTPNNLVNGTSAKTSHNKQTGQAAFVPTGLFDDPTIVGTSTSSRMNSQQDLLGLFMGNSTASTSSMDKAKNELEEIAELFDFRSASIDAEPMKGVDIKFETRSIVSADNGLITHEEQIKDAQQILHSDFYVALKVHSSISSQSECIEVWTRVAEQAFHVIDEAFHLFSRSTELTMELLDTEDGLNFIESVHAVHSIIERTRASMNLYKIEDSDLTSKCDEIDTRWKDFLKTEPGQRFLENHTASHPMEDSRETHRCGICLQSLAEERRRTEFVGRFYHTPCANFWINRINSLLPKLE